ncbi:MAG: response regulator [Nitrospinae bacterium]|nr:response regulator [Nitrospinota bacterium]
MASVFEGVRILLVDDVAEYRHFLSVLFRKLGVTHIEEADEGTQALELLARRMVDIAFIDLGMPGMGGIELIEAMRNHPRFRSIPIVVVTSDTLKETVFKVAQTGVRDYLPKPITLPMIEEKLNKYFGPEAVD